MVNRGGRCRGPGELLQLVTEAVVEWLVAGGAGSGGHDRLGSPRPSVVSLCCAGKNNEGLN